MLGLQLVGASRTAMLNVVLSVMNFP